MTVATPEEAAAILADVRGEAAAAPPPPPRSTPRPPRPRRPPIPRRPVEDNPLTRLRTKLTRIEDEIVALNGLKLPRLAQVSTRDLAVPDPRRRAGRRAGHPGQHGLDRRRRRGRRRRGRRDGRRLAGPVSSWPSPRSSATPSRSASSWSDAEQEVEQNKEWVKVEFERKLKEFEDRRANKVREAEETMARIVAEAEQKRQEHHQAADVKFPPLIEQVRLRRDEQMKKVEEVYPARIAARKEKYDADKKELDESYQATRTATEEEYARAWQALIDDWTGGMGADRRGPRRRQRARPRGAFLDWTRPELDGWKPPARGPARPAVRRLRGRPRASIPSGVPRDPRLKSVPTHFDLPALIPFPIMASTLIRAADSGRDQAITLLQALMLRFLTSIPAGKVRFTIIDPVGLGENFAAFMHLGDYHELLVTSRIWTEADPHRAAAHRPDRAHGERDPEVPAERVRDDRGIQHDGRRGRRAVPRSWSSPTSRPTSTTTR